jgi:hypothetical protein
VVLWYRFSVPFVYDHARRSSRLPPSSSLFEKKSISPDLKRGLPFLSLLCGLFRTESWQTLHPRDSVSDLAHYPSP